MIKNTKSTLISIDELKLLVHKESGYKIQIGDDDPLLTTLYVNIAVLGAALDRAGELHKTASKLIGSLSAIADKEMHRAGVVVIKSLSEEVSKIAQSVASDAAATVRQTALTKAVFVASVGILFCAVLFGGAGFLAANSLAQIRVDDAKRALFEANIQLEKTKSQVDETILELKKISAAEISKIHSTNAWAATRQGKLAKSYFDLGSGENAATCNSGGWEIFIINLEKWCVPKRRDIFGGDGKQYGWKIP